MHITTIDVMSLNGKLTKGDDPNVHLWTSNEDWEQFQALRDTFDLIVMGSGSYDAVQPSAEAERLRIVLTSRPGEYASKAVPGQLEFIDASPKELIAQMEKRGYTRMLLVGGAVNADFWQQGYVNELYVTVEPVLFGKGKKLIDNVDVDAQLRLIDILKLNDQGTLRLHYAVDNKPSSQVG